MDEIPVSHAPAAAPRAPQTAFHAYPPRRELALEAARATVVDAAAAIVASSTRRVERADWSRVPEATPGRVLAEPARADRDWPPFRRAMRDGYALRAADAGEGQLLPCVGQISAGEPAHALDAGTCVAIMTGAPVPDEADTVIMIEHTTRVGGLVSFASPPHAGLNIAAPGQESTAGAIVAAAGRRLTPTVIAALAQSGCLTPQVYARPRVAIVSTGNELVAPDEVPAPEQIRNSNGPMLAAAARRAGAEVISLAAASDEARVLRRALEKALATADVVLTSGGASVGARDHVQTVLHALRLAPAFDTVAMRPGHPQIFARHGDRLFFGLPGNPLGALLGFLMLVRPALEIFSGVPLAELPPAYASAVLTSDVHTKPLSLVAFRPVRLAAGARGVAHAVPLAYQGSADLAAAAAADGWLLVPPGVTNLASGAPVQVVMP
jgi:molybdopterin molybdotransferase